MPFKTFVAGEILTASDVNVHLGNQAISVFADSGARGSAITSPVEGQFAFLTNDDILTYWDGSAWEEYVTAIEVEALVVAGGGSGNSNFNSGGAGGAGGYTLQSFSVLGGSSFGLTIGAGGAVPGLQGSPTIFGILQVPGGGGGGFADKRGEGGASGGGGGGTGSGADLVVGGKGSQVFGNDGGNGFSAGTNTLRAGGGGGGAGAVGGNASSGTGGDGGVGAIATVISTTLATAESVGQVSGSDVYFSGGGGGGRRDSGTRPGNGGLGGGGNGAAGTATATGGASNTGGGGGGSGANGTGGAGGSGVIVFKVPSNVAVSFSNPTGKSSSTVGDFTTWVVKSAGAGETVTIG